MDLVQALAALSSVAVILGIVVAVIQVRILIKQRQDELVMQLHAPFYGRDLTHAYWYVQGLDLANYEAFSAVATLEDWVALDQVCSYFKAMGLLLHRGIAKVDLLDELLTASVFPTWNRCVPFVNGIRVDTGMHQNYQWFEYLVRTLDRHLTERGIEHPAPTAG